MENQSLVEKKIESIDNDFDQVLLLEYFEEGLILMADALCWPLEYVRT